ncbi:MAG: cytochrome P450 [Fulvivirga sp.]|uniref:cytochrome P450 n=1 Tax=Fulvivirga sp. TaxID=1931237 RepID=UPI0032EC22E9
MNLWNPLTPRYKVDPYPLYDQLRNESPIYKAQTGEWIVTGYNEVKTILINKNFGSGNRKLWIERSVDYLQNKNIDISHVKDAINTFVLQLDPPSHTRIRKFMVENWSKAGVEDIINDNINGVLSKIQENTVDLVQEYTSLLPTRNIVRILGITTTDYDELHRLCQEMIKALDLYVSLRELVTLDKSSKAFIDFFKFRIEQNNFEQGLARTYINENEKLNEPLTNEELTSLLIFLFVAAEETSVSFMSLSLYHIIQNGLIDEFRDSYTINHKLEELLRYDSPVQLLGRIALKDEIIGGVKINKGETTTLSIGGANRDPAQFKNPNTINLTRNPKHLSFGQGIHYCLGDWLAKLTASRAIPAFLNNFKSISINSEPANWYDNLAIRGFNNLKVTVKS